MWGKVAFAAVVATFEPIALWADVETDAIYSEFAPYIAEAGTKCIGGRLAIQDAARAIRATDPRFAVSRQDTAQAVENLAEQQDLLDQKAIYLRAIHWRDTLFRSAADVIIPAAIAGETLGGPALDVMRESQYQCQEEIRLINQRAAIIERHIASQEN